MTEILTKRTAIAFSALLIAGCSHSDPPRKDISNLLVYHKCMTELHEQAGTLSAQFRHDTCAATSRRANP